MQMIQTECPTIRLARCHSETLFALTRQNKWFISDKNSKYESFYERLAPVIEGTYPCPLCTIRYNLIRDLQSGVLHIPSFLAFGEEYAKHITSPERDVKLEEFKAFIRTAYDIDVVTYYEIYNLINNNALASYKTDESLLYHKVPPTVYFGVVVLHHPKLAGTAVNVSAEGTIVKFFKTYHQLLDSQGDVLRYIEGKYVLTQQERVFNAIVSGEKLVVQIQEERNLPRWEALTYCVEFGVVTDLFTWACEEFRVRGDELIALRPRLSMFADDNESPQIVKLKATIKKVQTDYYYNNVRDIGFYKRKKTRYVRRNGSKSLQEQYHGTGF